MADKRKRVRLHQRAQAEQREELERRWEDRIEETPRYASLVVARGNQREPYHRWLSYRQGFSAGLIRAFLDQHPCDDQGIILDPFSGSGTVAIEAARRGYVGVGIDAIYSLALLGAARSIKLDAASAPPDASHLSGDAETMMKAASTPLERCAILLAVSELSDGEGHRKRSKGSLTPELIASKIQIMWEDLKKESLPGSAMFIHGDARALPMADESVEAIVTSPPYISRYDYTRLNAPLDRLLNRKGKRKSRQHQVRASRAHAVRTKTTRHPAVRECMKRLEEQGHRKESSLLAGYFEDMSQALSECARVMKPGAVLWMVVAGVDLKRVYTPSDLILAELGEQNGLRCRRVLEVRRMRNQGRKLGALSNVAPRESVLEFRRKKTP